MLKWLWKYRLRIALNLLVWLFLFRATWLNNYNYTPPSGERTQYIVHVVLFNLCYIVTVYLNILWLMPRFLFRKKYGQYVLFFTLSMLLCAAVMAPFCDWMLHHYKGTDTMAISSISFGSRGNVSLPVYTLAVIPVIFMVVFVFAIGRLAQQFFEVSRQKEAIEKQQISAELNLLKSQINPHFLFNVLNSIYSLSLKKSDQTPEVVLRLSDILRYLLYETSNETVPLSREVRMLLDYIELEQIRVGSSQQFITDIHGVGEQYSIAPVLLIPFLENAVKHGMDSISEGAFIRLSIHMEQNTLLFRCRNNYKATTGKRAGGIGLENVRKRLELLYPGRYTLQITKEETIFEVLLTIELVC